MNYNDWVPCSKAIPEDVLSYNKNVSNPVINVLITTKSGKVTKVQRMGSKWWDDKEFFWSWGRIHDEVKAWMKLPDGYKGE